MECSSAPVSGVFRAAPPVIAACLLYALPNSAVVGQERVMLTESRNMCRNCIGVETVAVLGGDYDGDDLLSAGVDISRGPTGRTYVYDFGAGASEIFFYRSDGELEFIIRRRGEGPGEFFEPTAIVEMPGSGQLAVFDEDLLRLSILDADGTFVDSSPFPRGVMEAYPLSDSILLLNASMPTPENVGLPFHFVHVDGTILDSFGPENNIMLGTQAKDWRLLAVVGGRQFLSVAASGGPYQIEFWDGPTLRTVWMRETRWLSQEKPFRPSVRGIYLEGTRLWVLVRTPDPDWTEPPPRIDQEYGAQYHHDRFDTVLEVIDLTVNQIVASQRFDENIYQLFGDGTGVKQIDGDLGLRVYEILAFRLGTPPP